MTKKYIRTEDRIYEFEKVKTRKFLQIGNTSKEVELDEDESIFPYPILKQSDYLEELCDEFVVVGYFMNENRPLHFCTLHEALKFIYESGCQDKDYVKIKGAIWTDKDTIYVVERNKKGDFELL